MLKTEVSFIRKNGVGGNGRHGHGQGLGEDDVAHQLRPRKAHAQARLDLHPADGLQAAAKGFGHIPAAEERQARDGAGDPLQPDAHPGQAVIQKKKLDHQRGVAGQLDIDAGRPFQKREAVIADQGADQAQGDGQDDAGGGQGHRQLGRLGIDRGICGYE